MKKRWIIAVAVLVVLFTISLCKDLIIKVSVEKGVELATRRFLSGLFGTETFPTKEASAPCQRRRTIGVPAS